ncbi:MAG: RNA polymerase II mediator complex subunit [Claussenomyces sp. TS43310]|nr:MAG: RNA polymerase II mediator complex subunit [Claussenomyces sp. TS43310]
MADRLTQLQDAVDQLAHQFVACLYYVHRHHDLEPLSATDKVRDVKQESDGVAPYPEDVFKAGQRELAQDLILKEQQIEFLISKLPGLTHSERYQEHRIQELEDELRAAEQRRQVAIKEKEALLAKLEEVIRSVKRP